MNEPTTPEKKGMSLAVEKAGGQAVLAGRLGVSQQAISLWVRRGFAPLKRTDEIAQVTGVPARELMDPRVRKMVEKVATS